MADLWFWYGWFGADSHQPHVHSVSYLADNFELVQLKPEVGRNLDPLLPPSLPGQLLQRIVFNVSEFFTLVNLKFETSRSTAWKPSPTPPPPPPPPPPGSTNPQLEKLRLLVVNVHVGQKLIFFRLYLLISRPEVGSVL